jgi:hypothetical protein
MPDAIGAVSQNKVLVLDGFVSDAECDALTAWTEANLSQPFFGTVCGRTSTRFATGKVRYPSEAYEVQYRIINKLGLSEVRRAPFVDGIYSGYSRNGREYGYATHRDPVYLEGTYTLHCNVVTTNSPGGEVLLEQSSIIEMTRGRLVVYPVSEIAHQVLPANGNAPRNLWVFGFCVPIESNP